MGEKILVVEDDLTLQETLAYNLRRQGYTVDTTGNGREGLEMARQIHPDLILLDVMLPGMDGFEVCRTLRQEMNVPILIVTARDEEVDRVVGLELGADDYMIKPFSMRELLARVKSHLRHDRLIREEASAAGEPATRSVSLLVFDNLTLDLDRREALLRGQAIALKPKEYELLIFLAQHKNQTLSRDFILERVWGWEYIGASRTVDVHVRWLREKIEDDPGNPKRIITVRGGGYRFDG